MMYTLNTCVHLTVFLRCVADEDSRTLSRQTMRSNETSYQLNSRLERGTGHGGISVTRDVVRVTIEPVTAASRGMRDDGIEWSLR